MDKELKELFFITHEESTRIYNNVFGESKSEEILDIVSNIYEPRNKPNTNQKDIDKLISLEQKQLREIIEEKSNAI